MRTFIEALILTATWGVFLAFCWFLLSVDFTR
jgi:hypothetical protein